MLNLDFLANFSPYWRWRWLLAQQWI